MPTPSDPQNDGLANTYVIQNRQDDKELIRLTIQDQMITTGMGGVLPEQSDPTAFQSILDVGCGTGGWLIEAAKTYPTMSRLVGIDINKRMTAYAQGLAEAAQVTDRITFHVMDAQRILEFPDNTFDLVNVRFSMSFMRTWEWPKLVSEMLRVTRPGGVVRVTECEIVIQGTSPAVTHLGEMLRCAFYKAGHFFTNESAGMTNHLAEKLSTRGYGCRDIQTKAYPLQYRAGTTAGQAFYEDVKHSYLLVRPFIEKMGCASTDYDAIYQQALDEMQRSDFHATWNMLTAWGSKPELDAKDGS